MRKFIRILLVISILLSLLSTFNKEEFRTNVSTIKIKKLVDTKSQGWVWREKEITNHSDVEKILGKLKSFHYKDIKQDSVFGFGLIVEYKDGKDYAYVFSGDTVNINGKYYGITTKDDQSMRRIYDSLDYDEKPIEL